MHYCMFQKEQHNGSFKERYIIGSALSGGLETSSPQTTPSVKVNSPPISKFNFKKMAELIPESIIDRYFLQEEIERASVNNFTRIVNSEMRSRPDYKQLSDSIYDRFDVLRDLAKDRDEFRTTPAGRGEVDGWTPLALQFNPTTKKCLLLMLKEVQFFEGYSDEALCELIHRLEIFDVRQNSWLFHEGDSVDFCYILLHGNVIHIPEGNPAGSTSEVREFGRGCVLGFDPIGPTVKRMDSVSVVSRCLLGRINYRVLHFQRLEDEYALRMGRLNRLNIRDSQRDEIVGGIERARMMMSTNLPPSSQIKAGGKLSRLTRNRHSSGKLAADQSLNLCEEDHSTAGDESTLGVSRAQSSARFASTWNASFVEENSRHNLNNSGILSNDGINSLQAESNVNSTFNRGGVIETAVSVWLSSNGNNADVAAELEALIKQAKLLGSEIELKDLGQIPMFIKTSKLRVESRTQAPPPLPPPPEASISSMSGPSIPLLLEPFSDDDDDGGKKENMNSKTHQGEIYDDGTHPQFDDFSQGSTRGIPLNPSGQNNFSPESILSNSNVYSSPFMNPNSLLNSTSTLNILDNPNGDQGLEISPQRRLKGLILNPLWTHTLASKFSEILNGDKVHKEVDKRVSNRWVSPFRLNAWVNSAKVPQYNFNGDDQPQRFAMVFDAMFRESVSRYTNKRNSEIAQVAQSSVRNRVPQLNSVEESTGMVNNSALDQTVEISTSPSRQLSPNPVLQFSPCNTPRSGEKANLNSCTLDGLKLEVFSAYVSQQEAHKLQKMNAREEKKAAARAIKKLSEPSTRENHAFTIVKQEQPKMKYKLSNSKSSNNKIRSAISSEHNPEDDSANLDQDIDDDDENQLGTEDDGIRHLASIRGLQDIRRPHRISEVSAAMRTATVASGTYLLQQGQPVEPPCVFCVVMGEVKVLMALDVVTHNTWPINTAHETEYIVLKRSAVVEVATLQSGRWFAPSLQFPPGLIPNNLPKRGDLVANKSTNMKSNTEAAKVDGKDTSVNEDSDDEDEADDMESIHFADHNYMFIDVPRMKSSEEVEKNRRDSLSSDNISDGPPLKLKLNKDGSLTYAELPVIPAPIPVLSKRLRKKLKELIPREVNSILDSIRSRNPIVKQDLPPISAYLTKRRSPFETDPVNEVENLKKTNIDSPEMNENEAEKELDVVTSGSAYYHEETSLRIPSKAPSLHSVVADVTVVSTQPSQVARITYSDAKRLFSRAELSILIAESISWRPSDGKYVQRLLLARERLRKLKVNEVIAARNTWLDKRVKMHSMKDPLFGSDDRKTFHGSSSNSDSAKTSSSSNNKMVRSKTSSSIKVGGILRAPPTLAAVAERGTSTAAERLTLLETEWVKTTVQDSSCLRTKAIKCAEKLNMANPFALVKGRRVTFNSDESPWTPFEDELQLDIAIAQAQVQLDKQAAEEDRKLALRMKLNGSRNGTKVLTDAEGSLTLINGGEFKNENAVAKSPTEAVHNDSDNKVKKFSHALQKKKAAAAAAYMLKKKTTAALMNRWASSPEFSVSASIKGDIQWVNEVAQLPSTSLDTSEGPKKYPEAPPIEDQGRVRIDVDNLRTMLNVNSPVVSELRIGKGGIIEVAEIRRTEIETQVPVVDSGKKHIPNRIFELAASKEQARISRDRKRVLETRSVTWVPNKKTNGLTLNCLNDSQRTKSTSPSVAKQAKSYNNNSLENRQIHSNSQLNEKNTKIRRFSSIPLLQISTPDEKMIFSPQFNTNDVPNPDSASESEQKSNLFEGIPSATEVLLNAVNPLVINDVPMSNSFLKFEQSDLDKFRQQETHFEVQNEDSLAESKSPPPLAHLASFQQHYQASSAMATAENNADENFLSSFKNGKYTNSFPDASNNFSSGMLKGSTLFDRPISTVREANEVTLEAFIAQKAIKENNINIYNSPNFSSHPENFNNSPLKRNKSPSNVNLLSSPGTPTQSGSKHAYDPWTIHKRVQGSPSRISTGSRLPKISSANSRLKTVSSGSNLPKISNSTSNSRNTSLSPAAHHQNGSDLLSVDENTSRVTCGPEVAAAMFFGGQSDALVALVSNGLPVVKIGSIIAPKISFK